MNIRNKMIVALSIMLLGAGVLAGCGDREEEAAIEQTQEERDQLATRQPTETEEEARTTAERMQERQEATSEEIRGEQGRTTTPWTDQERAGQGSVGQQAGGTQSGQGLIGKKVMSNDDQELGEVAELEATGRHTGYVFIQGEDDMMHPVPASLLEDDAQGEGLRATFDRNAFEGSPSFSESELRNISDSQLEEVRGYYEEKANQ